jgi:hypothetical protein
MVAVFPEVTLVAVKRCDEAGRIQSCDLPAAFPCERCEEKSGQRTRTDEVLGTRAYWLAVA